MPGMNGFEATLRIREQHPQARVVLVSMLGEEAFVQASQKAGAPGIIVKAWLTPDTLREALGARD